MHLNFKFEIFCAVTMRIPHADMASAAEILPAKVFKLAGFFFSQVPHTFVAGKKHKGRSHSAEVIESSREQVSQTVWLLDARCIDSENRRWRARSRTCGIRRAGFKEHTQTNICLEL